MVPSVVVLSSGSCSGMVGGGGDAGRGGGGAGLFLVAGRENTTGSSLRVGDVPLLLAPSLLEPVRLCHSKPRRKECGPIEYSTNEYGTNEYGTVASLSDSKVDACYACAAIRA